MDLRDIAPRNVQGTDIVDFTFPANQPERFIQLFPQIAAQDYVDPKFSITARFYWTDPKDAVRKKLCGDLVWRGHPNNDPADPDQVFACQIDTLLDMGGKSRDVRGTEIRVELVVPERLRLGVKVVASDTTI